MQPHFYPINAAWVVNEDMANGERERGEVFKGISSKQVE